MLGNLGSLLKDQGRLPPAQEYYEASLSIAREVGDREGEGIILGNLSELLMDKGDWTLAAQRMADAIAICDQTMPAAAGAFRGSLALIHARSGDTAQARALLDRGEEQLRGVWLDELGKLLCKRGQIEHGADDLAAARAALTEAESIAAELGVTDDSELGKAVDALRALLG